MKKKSKLQSRLYTWGVNQSEIAEAIGKKLTYVSHRVTGKKPWTMEEVQIIGKMLEIPREEWLDYFSYAGEGR